MTDIVKGRLVKPWGSRLAGETVEVDAVRAAAMVARGELELGDAPAPKRGRLRSAPAPVDEEGGEV